MAHTTVSHYTADIVPIQAQYRPSICVADPLNKREALFKATIYIQIWCRCGYTYMRPSLIEGEMS